MNAASNTDTVRAETAVIRPTILCVDDEPHILASLRVQLRRDFDVVCANNGAEALKLLQMGGVYQAILSDMRMPQMNGATFLAKACAMRPEIPRLLLTGQSDLKDASDAVNQGRISRFLHKPCPPEELKTALWNAVSEHQRQKLEERVLEESLLGFSETLGTLLSLSEPEVFGRAVRIRDRFLELCEMQKIVVPWYVRIAPLLSELGAIVKNPMLDPADLLRGIPRFEQVLPWLQVLSGKTQAFERADDVMLYETLRMAIWPEQKMKKTKSQDYTALLAMWNASSELDVRAEIRAIFTNWLEMQAHRVQKLPVTRKQLQMGMRLAEDLCSRFGAVVVVRGQLIDETVLKHLSGFRPGDLIEPIYVSAM